MSHENRLWGTERIRGELLKLGIVVSNRSIRRYRWRRRRRPPSQTWRTFLANHAHHLWTADLFTVPRLTVKTLYVLALGVCRLRGQRNGPKVQRSLPDPILPSLPSWPASLPGYFWLSRPSWADQRGNMHRGMQRAARFATAVLAAGAVLGGAAFSLAAAGATPLQPVASQYAPRVNRRRWDRRRPRSPSDSANLQQARALVEETIATLRRYADPWDGRCP
jgi:hypothetical protein